VPNDNETLGPVGAACLVIRQVWLTERVKVPIYARRPDPGNFIAWPGPILRQLRRLAQEPEPTGLYALRALATTYDEDSAREMIDLVVTRQGKIQEQAFLNLAHYRRAGVILETVRVDFIDAAVQIATRRLPTEDAYVWAVQVALDEGSVASLLMACEELPSRMGGPRSAKLALQPFFETPLPDNDLAEWCRERKWSYDSEKRKFLQVE